MAIEISTHQTRNYQVLTPVYAGPLDLLLQLIEREELDITRLSLAQVTDQYLAYIKDIQDLSPDEVSAFLLIAAKLVQIKSEALLPLPKEHQVEEEDIGEALAKQLINYKRFKSVADYLAQRQEYGLRSYLRLVTTPYQSFGTFDINGITLDALITVAVTAFAESGITHDSLDLASVVKQPRVTVLEKIKLINSLLRQQNQLSFKSLFNSHVSRIEVMITFLAMLELIKRHYILATQETLFGDILIEASQTWDINEELDLEFE